jgi:DNA-binding NtrC family response regulator
MDKKKILIVDEDADIRLVLEECMVEEDYNYGKYYRTTKRKKAAL